MKVLLVPSFHYDNTWHMTSYAYARYTSDRIIKPAVDILKQAKDFHFTIDHLTAVEDFLKRYPEEAKYLRTEAKKGRVEIVGPMYTQMDCLVPSGESFFAQVFFGNKWVQSLLGVSPTTEWLGDVYGYCNQLPQILRKAGIKHLVFTLWWTNHNKYSPQAELIWEGVDGSRILAQLSPDYGGLMLPGDEYIMGCPCGIGWRKHNRAKKLKEISKPDSYQQSKKAFLKLYKVLAQRKGKQNVVFMHMGSDFREPHISNIPHLRRLNKDKDLPPVITTTADKYFSHINQKALSVYKGEINPVYYGRFGESYYETKARIKQTNRQFEYETMKAEFLASLALFSGKKYPQEVIEKNWQPILFYQHHDPFIGNIPKSEYDLMMRRWRKAVQNIRKISTASTKHLVSEIDTSGRKEPFVVFNSLGWPRKGMVQLDKSRAAFLTEIHPFGYEVISDNECLPESAGEISLSAVGKGFCVTNKFYETKINAKGDLTELYDKRTRKKVLKKNACGNEFILEKDFGCYCHVIPKGKVGSEQIEKSTWIRHKDKLKIHLAARVRIKNIKILKEIIFKSYEKRIDFKATVFLPDGKDLRLKVAFPLNFRKGLVSADAPFGWTKRSEGISPAINWVDYSSDKFGLTLFNKGTPSYEAISGNLHLHLIKGLSLKEPCGGCLPPFLRKDMIEKGRFQFDYAISAHGRKLAIARTVKEGYEFNFPLMAVKAPAGGKGKLPAQFNLLQIEPDNLVCNVVKKAEAAKDLIFRLYEIQGKKTTGHVKFSIPVRSAFLCNLLEKTEKKALLKNRQVTFPVKPYEIVTLRAQVRGR